MTDAEVIHWLNTTPEITVYCRTTIRQKKIRIYHEGERIVGTGDTIQEAVAQAVRSMKLDGLEEGQR